MKYYTMDWVAQYEEDDGEWVKREDVEEMEQDMVNATIAMKEAAAKIDELRAQRDRAMEKCQKYLMVKQESGSLYKKVGVYMQWKMDRGYILEGVK